MTLLKGKNSLDNGRYARHRKGHLPKVCRRRCNCGIHLSLVRKKAKALETELATSGVEATAIRSDAADLEQAEALVSTIVEKYECLDVVVNNAGISRDNLLMRMKEEDWDAVIETNLRLVFNVTKAVQRTMFKQRSGSIINISSVVGVKGNAGQANYAASKAGIFGFAKSMALELGSRNIRSNLVAPGFIETEMTAALDEKVVEEWRKAILLKRGGTPEDVVNAVLFLASDLSGYVTGQVISVCGGMLT